MQVIENFLEDTDFNEIQQLFLSRHFPWFFYEKSLEHDQTHFQFTHQIFTEHTKFNYGLIDFITDDENEELL